MTSGQIRWLGSIDEARRDAADRRCPLWIEMWTPG